MGIALCRNEYCEKSGQCLRFQEKDGVEISFGYICKESNNYKWFWQVDESIVVKEEK